MPKLPKDEGEERTQPVMVIKEKDIVLSVWPNQWGEKGKKITYYTFSLNKVSKDMSGQTKYQKSFPIRDAARLKMVLDKLLERKGELGPEVTP